jgi:hypothetical protein
LRSYTVHYDGADSLDIEMPDISFGLKAIQIEPRAGRLHLQFIAFDQIEYELRFRPDVNSTWTGPVAFALSPDGTADQTFLVGHADYAEVYLDPGSPAGFYAVIMRIKEV